ncbi:hypothetical protein AHF37_08653 [Paragonimus kellicotti]|nr:hypothetical protein AHF37_08653 [Paragonimus kellicotti]
MRLFRRTNLCWKVPKRRRWMAKLNLRISMKMFPNLWRTSMRKVGWSNRVSFLKPCIRMP